MFSLERLGPDTISDDERLGQDELAEVHGPLEDDGELTEKKKNNIIINN